MVQRISILMSIVFLLAANIYAEACTIFMTNNGKHVWIGNNEDESAKTEYRIWYFPKTKNSYGYMSWSELHPPYNSVMYKYPQGGLNEHGLFMDYTAIDEILVIRNPLKKDREEEVVNDILKSCKTVKEALRYISQFNLLKLSAAQLFIGDALGDYATVHGNYVIGKSTRYFALTNYSINNGHTEYCQRRETAMECLQKVNKPKLSYITDILSKTAQQPGISDDIVTNYSMAIDLKKKNMYLYLKRDYSQYITISLNKQLRKGKHYLDMAKLNVSKKGKFQMNFQP